MWSTTKRFKGDSIGHLVIEDTLFSEEENSSIVELINSSLVVTNSSFNSNVVGI